MVDSIHRNRDNFSGSFVAFFNFVLLVHFDNELKITYTNIFKVQLRLLYEV